MHLWMVDDTHPCHTYQYGCAAGCRRLSRRCPDAASTAGVFSSSKAAAYWSYHITRSGFFAIQGIAGMRHMAVVHTALRHACHHS